MVMFVDGLVRSCMYGAVDFDCLIGITINIDDPLIKKKKNTERSQRYEKSCSSKLLWRGVRLTVRRNVCLSREFLLYFCKNCTLSVHRNSILIRSNSVLIRSNKIQQYARIYLLQNRSISFGCPSHPSSGVHKIVTAASGTGHSIWATTFLQRGL